ncbi:sodium:calcium antiporter [Roseibium aquae]|uniref:Sodium:calcium antiporter n=1 Tax=Roseibium aquae TaxID=1323746 RepID=A0A916TM20_9HYPH|nr:calcium/sodium antiporter [Roseibium aquae]GGB59103.1 sodium:calcium antiporter [Roseibium aquae]
MDALLIAFGLAGLVAGGDSLVRGSVGIAKRLGLSPLLIGLVLVGFGTSSPELMTSVLAALNGSPGIAVGNVVGSNTANILLILGLSALLAPLVTDPAAMRRDGLVMLGAALAVSLLALMGSISRIEGGLLVGALIAYLVVAYVTESGKSTPSGDLHRAEADTPTAQPFFSSLPMLIGLTVGGLALTMAGANWLVTGASNLARTAGVSDAVIGLTVVAVGTSLPELVTAIVAAMKKQSDIALGNVLGSNIYNVLGILGTTALIAPLDIPAEIATRDVWIMLTATIVLLVFAVTGWKITRREGTLLLAGYGAYLAYLVFSATG